MADKSLFMRNPELPSDLLEVYLSIVSCDTEGGNADDDDDDEEEEEDDSEDPAAAEMESENSHLNRLAEAI